MVGPPPHSCGEGAGGEVYGIRPVSTLLGVVGAVAFAGCDSVRTVSSRRLHGDE
jgi:hypothetical protein